MNMNTAYGMMNYMNAYATAGVSSTNASLSITGTYLQMTGSTSGSYFADNLDDTANISSTARELADRVKNLDVFSCIFPDNNATKKTKTLGEVENDFMGDFNHFADAFGSMFNMLGLNSAASFTMGLDGVGGMTVQSGDDAATAGKLQSLFTQNSTFTARFAVMAARGALADAGYTLDGFKEQYADDPFAAIENNIDALKQRLLGFRANASEGTMQYGFEREINLKIEYSSTTAKYAFGSLNADNSEKEETAGDEAPAATEIA